MIALLMTMTVLIPSQSPQKIAAVSEAFHNRFPEKEICFISFEASSDVPVQPVGEVAAYKGVKSRLAHIPADLLEGATYAVSIENYIEEDAQHIWRDIGLILLKSYADGREFPIHSEAVEIPVQFVQLAQERSAEITDEGFSYTVGQAIHSTDERINPQDWHREAQFGGTARSELLAHALTEGLFREEIECLKREIVLYKDFPKPGVVFEDFMPLLANPDAFHRCIDLLATRYRDRGVEAVVGLESRGFILGAALAYKLGIGFIAVRKPGKIPGAVHSVSYEKEYGFDTLTISQTALKEGQRVLIIDDLIATGGSAKAAIELVRLAGGEPVEFVSLLEVKKLAGRETLGIPSFTLFNAAM